MAEENKSLNLEQLAYVGLAKKFVDEKKPDYAVGAMSEFVRNLSREKLVEGAERSLLSEKGGVRTAIETYFPDYEYARNRISLESLSNDFGEYGKYTIGDIELKIHKAEYVLSNPEKITKEKKTQAEKDLEEYNPIYKKIQMIQDKEFAKLSISAISRLQKMMDDAEKAKNSADD